MGKHYILSLGSGSSISRLPLDKKDCIWEEQEYVPSPF